MEFHQSAHTAREKVSVDFTAKRYTQCMMKGRRRRNWDDAGGSEPGLLMRPEHSETKAKTETRECETEIETETKNLS